MDEEIKELIRIFNSHLENINEKLEDIDGSLKNVVEAIYITRDELVGIQHSIAENANTGQIIDTLEQDSLKNPIKIENDEDYNRRVKELKLLHEYDVKLKKHFNDLMKPIEMVSKEITDHFIPVSQKQHVFETRLKEAIIEYETKKDIKSE